MVDFFDPFAIFGTHKRTGRPLKPTKAAEVARATARALREQRQIHVKFSKPGGTNDNVELTATLGTGDPLPITMSGGRDFGLELVDGKPQKVTFTVPEDFKGVPYDKTKGEGGPVPYIGLGPEDTFSLDLKGSKWYNTQNLDQSNLHAIMYDFNMDGHEDLIVHHFKKLPTKTPPVPGP